MDSRLWRNPLSGSDMRNKPCICGSGKKMKRCCGFKYAINKEELDKIKTMVQPLKNKMEEKK